MAQEGSSDWGMRVEGLKDGAYGHRSRPDVYGERPAGNGKPAEVKVRYECDACRASVATPEELLDIVCSRVERVVPSSEKRS